MTAEDLDEGVAFQRLHFGEGLMARGFHRTGPDTWTGSVTHGAASTEVELRLPQRFPYAPAKVRPTHADEVAWSWHRELNGDLCLVAEDDHDDLWWTDVDAFLGHVARWFEMAEGDWAGDRADMDLDRYFTPSSSDRRLYLYPDLTEYVGKPVRFSADNRNPKVVRLVGTGVRLSRGKDRRIYGEVHDVGIVTTPPRTWNDLESLLPDGARTARQIRALNVSRLVIRYTRESHLAAIVLEVWPTKTGIELRRLESSSDSKATRVLRAGTNYRDLQSKSVALIGVGAVGSFMAELLARAGVGHFTLVDADIVRPGNLIRHIASEKDLGKPKVDAVAVQLESAFGVARADINARQDVVHDVSTMRELLKDHDLVVNASADWAVTKLLLDSAQALGLSALSVALQNEGRTLRVDVLPTLDGGIPLPDSDRGETEQPVYETGCGSPVSLTPPPAVVEAAAVGTRHAIGLLTNAALSPTGEVRDLDLMEWEAPRETHP